MQQSISQFSRKNSSWFSSQEKEIETKFPLWLRRRIPSGSGADKTHEILNDLNLYTVCQEARCPNRHECHSQLTATFLAMGKECTRNCGFCSIDYAVKSPKPLESDEPIRLAEAVKRLGLKHVVITMVARDDLEDQGAAHLIAIIEKIREINPGTAIEILTSDFFGNFDLLSRVLDHKPVVFNHNLETVSRLTPRVRHKATYQRSLDILEYAAQYTKSLDSQIKIKSGIMVGLGEQRDEIEATILDLARIGCNIMTIGQYLQPDKRKLPVKRFVSPEEFEYYAEFGRRAGIEKMVSGVFVRSSYHAKEELEAIATH